MRIKLMKVRTVETYGKDLQNTEKGKLRTFFLWNVATVVISKWWILLHRSKAHFNRVTQLSTNQTTNVNQ